MIPPFLPHPMDKEQLDERIEQFENGMSQDSYYSEINQRNEERIKVLRKLRDALYGD